MDPVEVLARTEIFRRVNADDLQAIATAVRQRAFSRGAYIWHEGDPAVIAGVVLSGVVKFVRSAADGSEIMVDIRLPGGTMGEYHLLEVDSRRYYDAIAVERTECLIIARDSLRYHLERNPRLMWLVAAGIVRSSNDNYEALLLRRAGRDLNSRVRRELSLLADSQGDPTPEGRRIRFRLDQSLLAGYVGASRENVNRVLNRMAREGVISNDDGHIIVRARRRPADAPEPSAREATGT